MNPESESKSEEPQQSLRQIRTFQGDVAETIGRQKESLVSIQRAEKSRAEVGDPYAASGEAGGKALLKTALLIFATILLVGLGTLGGWYAYQEYLEKTAPAVISTPANRLISAARTVDIDPTTLSRSEIISTVALAEGTTQSGEITHINVPASTREFFQSLETNAPGNLIRSFEEIFMLGVLESVGSHVFVLIPVSSFENAFAGMLAWEESMAQDIGPLFSTRIALGNVPPGTEFRDVITRNKNARVLYLPDSTEALLVYSFFDNNTLIITDSEEALETLLGRLSSELLSR